MPELNSIKEQIPLTDQTNPNKFPSIEYRSFPYMPSRLVMNEKTGQEQRLPFLTPSGGPIIVHDEDEEAAFREAHPEADARSLSAADVQDELAKLREENAKLRALQEGALVETKPAKVETDGGDVADKPNAVSALVKDKAKPAAPRPGKRLDD